VMEAGVHWLAVSGDGGFGIEELANGAW
jgi:hypothetical protein